MITWVRLWTIFLVVPLLVWLPGAVPQFSIRGRTFGGGYVRQWFANNVVYPVVPADWWATIQGWYMTTSYAGELALHSLIAIDIGLLSMPLVYVLGTLYIRFLAWLTKTDFSQKTTSVRR